MATRSVFRLFFRVIAAFLLLALPIVGGGLYWLGSQQALEWLASRAVEVNEGRLVIEGVQGSLYDRITVAHATYKDAELDLEARSVVLKWRPQALLWREARVTELAISDLRVTGAAEPAEPLRLPAALQLPLNATIGDVRVQRFEFSPGRVIRDLHFRLSSRAESHALELVNIEIMGARASGAARVGTTAPFVATGRFDVAGKVLGEPIQVRVTAGGTLAALQLHASTSARGASAMAAGLLRPFSALPLEKLTLDAENIDLAAWDRTLPRTKARVSLEAGMSTPEKISGTLRVKNDDAGPVDARRVPLSVAALSFAGRGTRWMLSDIDLHVGKSGRVRGSGTVEGENAHFELALADIGAADLHSRLQALSVSGRAAITGDTDGQRIEANLESAGVRLALAARHSQRVLTIERGELRAHDGRLDFTGHSSLSAKREFSVSARFSGLDPARFMDSPPARLNGTASARGALAPEWQAQVSLAITDSRLRGHPLSASAEFKTSPTQPFSGKAHAAYAGNRLDAAGGFGAPDDRLKWSLIAPNLKAIDDALAGTIRGHGTLAGSLDRLSVEFTVAAQKFAAGEVAAAAIDAQGTVDAGTGGAVRLAVKAAGLKVRTAALGDLRLDAQGTRLRHQVTAVLGGGDFSASMNGAGGLDDGWRWSGTVAALDARGRVPFRLTAPAQVTVGRGLLAIEGLQAAALGGVIGPASVRFEDGRVASRGTAKSITAKALIALAPLAGIDPRDFAVGARWDLAVGETISGHAEIFREAGDLGLRAERNLPLGLDQFRLNATAEGNAFDVAIDAKSARMGTLAGRVRSRLERRDDAWALTGNAPLDGEVTLDMQSLAWVRGLVPQLDQVGGRAAARLTIAGTAGKPLLTGSASADDVHVRAIGPGLHLTGGTLRAGLDGHTLKVTRFYLKAGDGKIEADGAADLSDGLKNFDIALRAERARILESPVLTVVVSGTGRAGLRERRLALDGKLRIDEGRYDLGSERKPELGDDIVIVGRTPPASAKPMRIALDVTIDLSDNFTVRGHGLDAVLGGSLRLVTRGESLQSLGTIRTVRGEYFAYGQLLGIQRGELNFSGPLGNPGLNLRATRKIRPGEVGVEATGSLARPVVKLVSDPAMSDSDRLGWLVLGRDPQTASAAELAILQAAALNTGTRRTTPIQKQIAEGLGLDEFGVSHGGGGGALGVLALGKRISDRLAVRLEQSLGGTAGGLLKIDYLLSQRWRLEGTAGAENAADVLFTLRFD